MKTASPACRAFGATLRRLRQERGYSQESFADGAGLHRTYVGGLERGERNPTLDTICRVAKTLAVEPAALLDGIRA